MAKKTEKNLTEKKERKEVNFGVIALIITGVVILLAVAMTVVMFCASLKSGQAGGDVSSYLAIFAILITVISIVVPITSYITNKDEIKKITREFEVKSRRQEEEQKKLLKALDEKSEETENRNVELLEDIILRRRISHDPKSGGFAKVYTEYVNALVLFENGAFDKCSDKLIKLTDDFIRLIETDKADDCGKGNLAKKKDKQGDLLYKILNLNRKLGGRQSFSNENVFPNINKVMTACDGQLYQIALYFYIVTRFDKIKKSFKHVKNESKENFIRAVSGIDNLKTNKFQRDVLTAYKFYILAFYYKELDKYDAAIKYLEAAYFDLKDGNCAASAGALKRLDSKSKFTLAKLYEKTSYYFEGDAKKPFLDKAEEIVNDLISRDKSHKYFLELSEILKKQGKIAASDRAAEYGFRLSPTDPLLAAQCAYTYLRKYLENPNDLTHLHTAANRIEIAYWTYSEERADASNTEFSYIASMHAVIRAYEAVNFVNNATFDAEIEAIKKDINNSIADNPNNLPNYRRAFLVYCALADKFAEKRAAFADEMKKLIVTFRENTAFDFGRGELKDISGSIRKIDINETDAEKFVSKIKKVIGAPTDNI